VNVARLAQAKASVRRAGNRYPAVGLTTGEPLPGPADPVQIVETGENVARL
jgi:hypothetical protein